MRRTIALSVSPLFLAVIEATEKAIDNSLFKAVAVGGPIEPLPIDRALEVVRKHGGARTP
jgi:D-aminopeptidase